MLIAKRRLLAGLAAAAALALAGCSQASGGTQLGCYQAGVAALQRGTAVRVAPPACHGLTAGQIDAAVDGALRAVAAAQARGKAAERAREAALRPLLAPLIRPVTSQAPSAPPARPGVGPGLEPFGLLGLLGWLVTVGLGAWMLAGWIAHGGLRRPRGQGSRPRSPGRLPPSMVLAHGGLALAGLLAWAVYLITRWAGAGWAGCGTLVVVTGLGVTLISLWLPERQPGHDTPARHPPGLIVAAHGLFALVTAGLVLTAIAFA